MNTRTTVNTGTIVAIAAVIAFLVPAVSFADDLDSGPDSPEVEAPDNGSVASGKKAKRKGWAKARAHRNGKRGLMAQKLLKRADKIGLDANQVEALEAEVAATKPKLEALREEAKAAADAQDKEAMKRIRKEAKGIVKASNERARNVLTAEQKDDIKEKMKKRGKKRGKDKAKRRGRGKRSDARGPGHRRGKSDEAPGRGRGHGGPRTASL